jgi:hypothetical protein
VPNIIAQSINSSGIYIKASNGVEFQVPSTGILDFHGRQVGSPAQRKAQTINWIRTNLVTILGESIVDSNRIERLDFDISDGRVITLRIRS